MTVRVALPILDPTRARACVESMSAAFAAHVSIVDNTAEQVTRTSPAFRRYWLRAWAPEPPQNVGVAYAWNLVAREVVAEKLDWLVLASEAITFGAPGGEDLIDALCDADPADGYVGTLFGWKLIALSRPLLEDVGRFDEKFWPAYYEDTDYLYRMGLAGWPSPRENGRSGGYVEVDATCVGDAHCVKAGLASPDFGRLRRYYRAKWGGDQGSETYRLPFDGRQSWSAPSTYREETPT